MNEELAKYYGTLENLGIDKTASDFQLEKMAEAQVLDEMFQAEGYDINQTPTDEIVKIAHELFGDDSALVKQAAALEQEAPAAEPQEETFQEKVAEADYLGRLMAHAYVNELAEIEKRAAMPESLLRAAQKAKDIGGAVAGKAKAMKESYRSGASVPKWPQVTDSPSALRRAGKGMKKVIEEHPGTAAATAGGLGLGTGALLAS